MVELIEDRLSFAFPEVHPEAKFSITFRRTLRIPDDSREYPLPPGLGSFPLTHIDDHATRVPQTWLERGGVMMPMWQAEALWIDFDCPYIASRRASYPFAVKIAAGKVNAVNGKRWTDRLKSKPQNYVVLPDQPWLDGFCVAKGVIRQFVATEMGKGITVEEQLSGTAEWGGIQVLAVPIRGDVFEKRFPVRPEPIERLEGVRCLMEPAPMGLGLGGKIRQKIYPDRFKPDDWHTSARSRVFVHIANATQWKAITGSCPTQPAPTAEEYTDNGLPWFKLYDVDQNALKGADTLAKTKTVAESNGPDHAPASEGTHARAVANARTLGANTSAVREWLGT